MSEEIDIDHLRSWIGKQSIESDVITNELLQRFKAMLAGYTELSTGVPLAIHWCLAQPAVASDGLGVDGHLAKGGFLPPVPLPRRMWASSKLRFHAALKTGSPIERTSTIADVSLKQSSASGPLVFVQVDHSVSQDGQTVIDDRQTIVYRQFSEFKAAEPQEAEPAVRSLNIKPNSTLLFRYSAVTFNGHRIHYDQDYTTTEEGYPGLVVQGPLMATLLMNLAQAGQPDSLLRSFEFRSAAPAFVDQYLALRVNDEQNTDLEIRNHHGALIMSAKAGFGDNDAS